MTIAVDIPAPEALVSSFRSFEHVAAPVLHIRDDAGYRAALHMLDRLFEIAPDDPEAAEHGLIELIAKAVERYENTMLEVQAWNERDAATSADVSMLRLLMDQHGLTGSDFENEIGGKSYVSQILAGDKKLTRKHIERLATRFAISPALFFG